MSINKMSVVFETKDGTFISTEEYFNNIVSDIGSLRINSRLFEIHSPYSHRKKETSKKHTKEKSAIQNKNFENEINTIHDVFLNFLTELKSQRLVKVATDKYITNKIALKIAEFIYEESGKNLVKDAIGCNIGAATVKTVNGSKYIFPRDCQFFSKNVCDIQICLSERQFDLILLDPPWWNKYIRRKRKRGSSYAYNMMYDCDLRNIPIESLLSDTGMLVVWCTNSLQHLNYLLKDIFFKWNVQYVAKWYWVKVTEHGEPICAFSKPPGKQPFEQIIIGYRNKDIVNLPPDGKLIVSVPSAIHSHKPPLVEVLRPFLSKNPKCLEIFARYLLPGWTSYGNEVLRFQHESLYTCKE